MTTEQDPLDVLEREANTQLASTTNIVDAMNALRSLVIALPGVKGVSSECDNDSGEVIFDFEDIEYSLSAIYRHGRFAADLRYTDEHYH